jgi:hypothetical protein
MKPSFSEHSTLDTPHSLATVFVVDDDASLRESHRVSGSLMPERVNPVPGSPWQGHSRVAASLNEGRNSCQFLDRERTCIHSHA